MTKKKLGKRLKAWRKETLGITMVRLIRRIRVSQGSWSDIENGKSAPSYLTLCKMRKAMKDDKKFLELVFDS